MATEFTSDEFSAPLAHLIFSIKGNSRINSRINSSENYHNPLSIKKNQTSLFSKVLRTKSAK